MRLFLCSFHFNLCLSLLSPHRHIEVFLASFLSLLFISPLAISQTPRYVWQCVVTHGALSSCSLLPSHLSVPISSQHPFCSAFTQIVFLRTFSSFLSATNRKGVFFGAASPPVWFVSFHSPLTFFLPLSIICPVSLLGFPLPSSYVGRLDSCWHLAAVPFLPSLPARLRWMTGALVEVLLWLLARAVSQGAPSACLSSLSVPGPWPPNSHTPCSHTKLLSVHRPHVSGLKPLFKTQVLPRRHCSSNSEGTMKERV